MERKEIVLAALSTSNCDLYTPVQVQKLFFLIDTNIADKFSGPHFNFEPYNYGPFDKEVYTTLEDLSDDEDVEILSQGTWRSYRLSEKGQLKGLRLFASLDENVQNYIRSASEFVRKLSFSELVTAIYKAYPDMKAKSVFQS